MNEGLGRHRTLERQLRRLGLAPDTPPDLGGWARFLDRVSASYRASEDDRYTLERSIEISSDEMRALHDVLSRQARHDTLTGLPNRAALVELLRAALDESRLIGSDVAVLFIDLDGFKMVNDSLGHPVGDELLIRVAERIQATIRGRDVVARLGGDEFVVILRDVDGFATATATAERIVDQLGRPFRMGGNNTAISASIGIALANADALSVDDLLRRADMAMYEAKAGGRSQYTIFNDDVSDRLDGRLATINALRDVVEANQLVMHYQPIMRIADRTVTGVEALVRWQRPGHGLLAADSFIPIAEESHVITAIDAWAVKRACEEFTASKYRELTLSVNLSARDLQHSGIVDTVSNALQSTGLRPDQLVMELTETTLAADNATTAANLGRLRALGVRLAIDDFGTGYSSLSYLRQIPAQSLKIDRSFVSALDVDESSVAIVGAVVGMGHALGMQVIAEGVENAAQLERLAALECDQVQGYLVARPQPLRELTESWSAVPVAVRSTNWTSS
ncbi:putative bifunctional diguanylate cyclase/phosphodiesterase [Actinoplanes solisilvae]|uniref:putative bifunctional diguanylate cyclase/phosphodiesterase n=1 Tax=Actinoplanes solisilvae TaxID=2486853 RepID=UPI000FDB69D1|nr:EAL domain-containing protein [Actinoplanes solisilvae]